MRVDKAIARNLKLSTFALATVLTLISFPLHSWLLFLVGMALFPVAYSIPNDPGATMVRRTFR